MGIMTRSSKADARMMNFLVSLPDRDVWTIASRLHLEHWTYCAQTGLLDFKSCEMVVSLESRQPAFPQSRVYLRSTTMNMLNPRSLRWPLVLSGKYPNNKTLLANRRKLDAIRTFGYTESLH